MLFSNSRHLWKSVKYTKAIFSLPRCGNVIGSKFSIRLNSSQVVSVAKDGRAVGWWLAGCGGMVLGAVVLGGVTRLTESGLSMVTWRLLGESIPWSSLQWEEEFKKYQQFPEYKIKNREITLEEFKKIWWMEYAHRSWGRVLGAVFFVPAAAWWWRGRLSKLTKRRVAICGVLIAAQGLMGWYMVKSGLQDRFHDVNDVPRVSQYRLAAHLSLAFTLYSFLLWSALDVLLPASQINPAINLKRLRTITHSCKALVFLTAVSGAFVAGLDAGLVYNSFPKMADRWIPEDIFSLNPFWKNFTENTTTVQFNHRILGLSTLSLVSWIWIFSRRCVLPQRAKTAVSCLMIVALTQATLGVSTLLLYVPTPLAATHQTGSLVLLSTALWLSHELKHARRIVK